ncbi:MAG: ABC transporter permease [Desulfurococcales archaeon]|nr:ABC transporter permease [Desulfurococcales archaeon]MCE4605623.1 ABC transporter permease [Desulfurococcales archaeon]
MSKLHLAALPLILFLLAFFYVPLAVLAYYSIVEEDGSYGLSNYLELLQDPAYLRVILYSIVIAGQTTIATLLLSLPAAYYIAVHSRGLEKAALLVAMITPFWIDFLLRALAIKNLMYLLDIREGYTSMMAGMIYDYLPYMFLPVYASLAGIRGSLLQAARILGATPIHVATKIILPLALPGIVAGSILVFLMSMTEYVIPALLGGTQGFTVGTLIYYLFLSGDKWGQGSALTLIITLSLLIATIIISRRRTTS